MPITTLAAAIAVGQPDPLPGSTDASSDGTLMHEAESQAHLWGPTRTPDGESIFTTDLSGRAARWAPGLADSVFFGRP